MEPPPPHLGSILVSYQRLKEVVLLDSAKGISEELMAIVYALDEKEDDEWTQELRSVNSWFMEF